MSHLSTSKMVSSCPNSFQLLLACRPLPPRFVRFAYPDRRATLFSISDGRRWRMTASASDFKASDAQLNSPDSGAPAEAENNNLVGAGGGGGGGVVASALAAVVLAAGVAFAIAFMYKQKALRPKKDLEVLAPHQEEILATDIEEKGDEDDKKQSADLIDDIDTLQNTTAIANAHVQDAPQDDSALSDVPLAPDVNLNSNDFPGQGNNDNSASNAEESYGSPFSSILQPDSDTTTDSFVFDSSNELSSESNTTSLDIDEPTEMINLNAQTPVFSGALSETHTTLDFHALVNDGSENESSAVSKDDSYLFQTSRNAVDENYSFLGAQELDKNDPSEMNFVAKSYIPQPMDGDEEKNTSELLIKRPSSQNSLFAGVPAPSIVSPDLQVPLGKIVVPAVVDQVQSQALAALQALKVIEADAQPGDLCTRREYARWLVSASSVLSRSPISKVYPAMYIVNVTELAFDDVKPEDPDFPSIQGLAEAGLIASKLSGVDALPLGEDKGPLLFSPESPLSRQDLVSWKMALETRNLPEADRKILYQASGFLDIDRIDPAAWPAIVADLASGDHRIIPLAFGYTRLFQPAKPVTKAQVAIALAVGESSDVVNEELARIEAESMAENAVAAHSALVAQVEKDVTDSFEKELLIEREMISAVEKMAEEAKQELEKIRSQREEDKLSFMKEKAAVESEMEVLSKLRRELDAQLYDVLSNKVEISYEKERIIALRKEVETENQEIARLQYELEIERKALSMARAWAEEEAKRAREQAKALEEARERWERRGIQIVVDDDLRQDSVGDSTWVDAGKMVSVKETSSRAEILVAKLKTMADCVSGHTRKVITMIIEKIAKLISVFKEQASIIGKRSEELRELTILKARETTKVLQQSTEEFKNTVAEGAKGVVTDCKRSVEKLTHRFEK
uniref:SLH domain-containing protein n=1 Tax=Kalanchoe fedtschenkoi TaxID=63787 RepID=A0A7N0U9S8_KALFE